MNKKNDLGRYNMGVCPRCDEQVPVTDVSVDENLYTTFYYKCKCGLSWTKVRGLELTQEELMSMVALTKKLLPMPRAVRRS